jgi:hypothetical protein
MNQLNEPGTADVRAAMAALVATEPELPTGSADIERRGRRRLAQQRWGVAAAALVVAAAGVSAISLTVGSGPATPVAQPPAVTGTNPDGNTGLAEGFPIGSAVEAVGSALPAGASLGELPMDIAWRVGGLLDVPVATTGGPATVTIQVVDGTCTATVAPVGALSADDLGAIGVSVCIEWFETGSLPVIPGVPGAEQPDLAAS